MEMVDVRFFAMGNENVERKTRAYFNLITLIHTLRLSYIYIYKCFPLQAIEGASDRVERKNESAKARERARQSIMSVRCKGM